MKFVLLLLVAAATTEVWSKTLGDRLFAKFVREHFKNYDTSDEYELRKRIFLDNVKVIDRKNAAAGKKMYGVNHFTDLTHDEWKKTYTGCLQPSNVTLPAVDFVPDLGVPMASSLDWRDHGAVTEVKNQLRCQTCYIFSAIGSIEGQYAIKHRTQAISLSEQQGVDCAGGGCERGGDPTELMNFVASQGGSEDEQSYPYIGATSRCQFDRSKVRVQVAGGRNLNVASEEALAVALQQYGPLSIGIFAGTLDMQHYDGSHVLNPNCGQRPANHAVLLVGYGVDPSGQPYWLIKNSWGAGWGDQGYLRLIRGQRSCAILTRVSVASVR